MQRIAEECPALEFLNTRRGGPNGPADAVDGLGSYDDVAAWATKAGLLRAADLPASGSPRIRARSFQLAIGLRSAFDAYLTSRSAPARRQLIERVNTVLASRAAVTALVFAGDAFGTKLRFDPRNASVVPFAIATAIADCLERVPLDRIKRCSAADCIWYFVDTTKNGSRRWCTSDRCGARHRARKHYRVTLLRPRAAAQA